MNKEKMDYTLEQLSKGNKTEVELELDDEQYQKVIEASNKLGITISQFVELSLVEKLIEVEYEKLDDTYGIDEIIDIYDFYRLEDLINSKKTYLVINPSGKHVVLMPYVGDEDDLAGVCDV